MEHDDIIRMAREVADPDTVDPLCGGDQRDLITLSLDEMVRFAALVAAREREEASKDCETLLPSKRIFDQRYYDAVEECVATIRARGEK